MLPAESGTGVVFNPADVEVFTEAFETTRSGMNYENLPECLAPKRIHLPESDKDGNVVLDDRLLSVAHYSAQLAVKVTTRDLHRLGTEYETFLDSDDEDQHALLGILQAEMAAKKQAQEKFQSFSASILEFTSHIV